MLPCAQPLFPNNLRTFYCHILGFSLIFINTEFFARLGFAMAQREDLPDKIHKDCCVCPRFHQCDEVAMVRGELPKFAMLPQPASWLVKIEV